MKRKFKRIEIGERFLYNVDVFSKTQDEVEEDKILYGL